MNKMIIKKVFNNNSKLKKMFKINIGNNKIKIVKKKKRKRF